ncbi:MAG: ROK family protein [Myxococcota bacterium]
MGGTKVVLAVGRTDGTTIAARRQPMPLSGDWRHDLDALVAASKALLSEAEVAPEALLRVGVSVPGPVDPARGVLINPPNLPGWADVPVAAHLRDALGAPTRIENDANAAALAEARFGAGQGVEDLVYLTMSTGVGGGLISGGRLVHGAFGAAGEPGHLPIVPDGRPCACGLRGCLEAYTGGNAWRDHLRGIAPTDSDAVVRAGGDPAALRPEHVVEAARAGDAWANGVFGTWLDDLAQGIAAIVMLVEPRRIVLGTIAVAAGEALCFTPLRARLATRLWPQQAERLEIVPAALGDALPERAGFAVAMEPDAR